MKTSRSDGQTRKGVRHGPSGSTRERNRPTTINHRSRSHRFIEFSGTTAEHEPTRTLHEHCTNTRKLVRDSSCFVGVSSCCLVCRHGRRKLFLHSWKVCSPKP